MSEQVMYWITRADEIKNSLGCINTLFCVTSVLSFVGFLISTMIKMANEFGRNPEYLKTYDDYLIACALKKIFIRIFIVAFSVLSISFTTNTFIPTTKDYVAIKVIPAIINNEKLKNISTNFVDLAEKWLKDLKETKNIH